MKTLIIGFLVLVMMIGQLNADENTTHNKITLNLDDASEVLVEGIIASSKDTTSKSFEDWDSLVNLKVTEPEKRYPGATFRAFLPRRNGFDW